MPTTELNVILVILGVRGIDNECIVARVGNPVNGGETATAGLVGYTISIDIENQVIGLFARQVDVFLGIWDSQIHGCFRGK